MTRRQVFHALAITALGGLSPGCGPEPAALAERPSVEQPAVSAPASAADSPSTANPQAATAKPAVSQPASSSATGWMPDVPLRDWEFIVLHHTATEVGDVPTISKEHQKRKDSSGAPWRGIGYHFLIGNGRGMQDGEVEPTFRWTEQSDGAHAGSLRHNERGIGICLVGNFNKTAPTKKQRAALRKLMAWLQQETGIPDERVLRHSDIKTTDCPGRKFALPR